MTYRSASDVVSSRTGNKGGRGSCRCHVDLAFRLASCKAATRSHPMSGRLTRKDELSVVVEIVPALPEEADALRVRQLGAIRRFLEAVVRNREAAGVSGLT